MSDGAKITAGVQKKLTSIMSSSPFKAVTPPGKMSNFDASQYVARQQTAELYMVACMGKSYFEKAVKVHKKMCEDLGVWDTDHVAKILPGVPETVFNGVNVIITCKKNNPGSKVDVDALITELVKAGVDKELLSKAIKKATVETTPATRLEASAL